MTPPTKTLRVGWVSLQFALRLYRGAIYLYPSSFRRRFGQSLLLCCEDQLTARAGRSSRAALGLFVRTLADAPRGAFVAWVRWLLPRGPMANRVLTRGENRRDYGPGRSPMMPFFSDLRRAARTARKRPAVFVLAVLSLTLGAAATATLLSTLGAALWMESPAPHPERLTRLVEVREHGEGSFSYANYTSVKEQTGDIFEGVALHVLETFAISTEQEALLTHGELVTANYFQTLGIRPALGRFFDEHSAEAPTQPLQVVLSHSLWQRAFDGDRSILGRVLRINDLPMTVVGVAEPGFHGTKFVLDLDLWVPVRPWGGALGWGEWETQRDNSSWLVFARRRPGVEIVAARRALEVVAERLAKDFPETNRATRFEAYDNTLGDATPHIGGAAKMSSRLAFGVCLLVLMVAAGNVLALFMARSLTLARELGIRHALGARSWELLRQMLAESVLVGLLSGLLALPFLLAGGRLALRYLPMLPYRLALATTPRPRISVVVLGLTVMAALLAGLLPAWRAVRRARGSQAVGTARHSATGGTNRGLDLLVVGMVAAAFCALVIAALFSRSLSSVRGADPGFRDSGQMTVAFDAGLAREPAPDPRRFFRDLIEEAVARPEFGGAAVASVLPLGDRSNSRLVYAEDRAYSDDENGIGSWTSSISPDYFHVMGTTILAGRVFDGRDGIDSDGVIVNRTLAHELWPEGDWIGRRLRFRRETSAKSYQVVGVAQDGRYQWIAEPRQAAVFLPFERDPASHAYLLVTREAPELAAAQALRKIARGVDPRIPAFDMRSITVHLRGSFWAFRLGAELAAGLALLALILALAGLYGVIAYRVEQRSREFGIRLAVGAGARQVLMGVLGRGLRLSFFGLTLGTGLALAAGGVLSSLLVGVSGRDPWTFVMTATLIAGCVLLASLRPAWRASSVDPARALRTE